MTLKRRKGEKGGLRIGDRRFLIPVHIRRLQHQNLQVDEWSGV
jgi:hypothetical protein